MSPESGSPITTYFRLCDGVRIRFADTGADSESTLLMLVIPTARSRTSKSISAQRAKSLACRATSPGTPPRDAVLNAKAP
jgi:hypothetical protein